MYRWGVPDWHTEFETPCGFIGGCAPGTATKSPPLAPYWDINHPRLVEDKWGELVVKGEPDGRPVAVKLTGHAHRYGRWEVRVFGHQIQTTSPYRLIVDLVPARKAAYHCGAQNITMADYVMGADTTNMSIRTLPDREFTYSAHVNAGPWDWNTYAVEMTKTHISWFVDDKVVMTERRPAARSGALYTLRLRLLGDGATDSTPPKMQLDWTRHFDLHRKNQHSIAAPQSQAGTFTGGC